MPRITCHLRALLSLALAVAVVPSAVAATANPWSSHCGRELQLPDGQLSYHPCFEALALEGASISATAYVAQQAKPRPVLFLFNGGPGASSSSLHFAGVGPKLKARDAQGEEHLQDNPETLLAVADLVFIDPPGTGFSESPQDEQAQAAYWSTAGDAKAVNQFMHQWLAQHQRQDAKVFIAGESYGGYRLATLAGQLDDLNMGGLLLVSPLLDGSAAEDAKGNDLPFVMALPSLAVAAATQGKGAYSKMPVAELFQQAKQFAITQYAPALMLGNAIPAEQATQLAQALARYTGLAASTWLQHNLRISAEDFRNMLLAEDNQVFGRLDSRVLAAKPTPKKDRPSALDDPALGLKGGLVIKSPAIAHELQQLTGIKMSRDYLALNLNVNFHWQYVDKRPPGFNTPIFYFNPTPNIAALQQQQPTMKIMVLSGYYDLAVPALAAWYALVHAGVSPAQMQYEILPAGHSIFADPSVRKQLQPQLTEFLK
ncbi:alpha/beta fold hydrolase [Shewanella dokdonensis]|nr:alpha/beta fold hydrolase [Shewanella dokdonensis]MCL1074732.1 alpha/beta fold hydrolase [Shewanella dokdonensis]